ncbi:LLM class flavin-dependent oxidoreductase [Microbacterium sp. 18062]|uniref:LLM class flavin-dependent oxidoreductase n=1 Tax=Microbacterium sp. 18062 TaxID=2681410 RepID=UPI00135B30CE|nr:LLM class flavin-dependent oxidoreductase [Microbacterium sp. 18062]
MSARDGLFLGVNLQSFGQRPAAWQVQDVAPDALLHEAFWQDVARTAERGLIDTVFFADHPAFTNPNPRPLGVVDPFVLAATVAAATERLGVVVSGSTSYNDPVDLAARVLSLDVVSGGRIGWNVVTTYSPDVAGNFGGDATPPRSERYARAEEFTGLVRALWRSARTGERVVAASDRFGFDASLGLPPSPQGEPVLFQAGGSSGGRALAARHADGVFTVELTEQGAIANRRALREAAASVGRSPGDVTVVPGLSLVLGSTEAEAVARYDELEGRVPQSYMLGSLSAVLGADASILDLDAPIPGELIDAPWDPDAHVASVGYRQTFLDWIADRRGATVREVLRQFGGYGARIVIGTPEQVADGMERWFRVGAADGFNLMLDRYPDGLAEFVEHVVPLLQRRGVYRRAYEASTLGGRLRPRRD